jgi:hypothetical protein
VLIPERVFHFGDKVRFGLLHDFLLELNVVNEISTMNVALFNLLDSIEVLFGLLTWVLQLTQIDLPEATALNMRDNPKIGQADFLVAMPAVHPSDICRMIFLSLKILILVIKYLCKRSCSSRQLRCRHSSLCRWNFHDVEVKNQPKFPSVRLIPVCNQWNQARFEMLPPFQCGFRPV